MIYLYMIMMHAWDLDKDTHDYFRIYLDGFINKRKVSKDLRDFVIDSRSRAITSHIRPGQDTESIFNELRICLPNRIKRGCVPLAHDWRLTWLKQLPPQTDVDRLKTETAETLVGGSIDYKLFQGGRTCGFFSRWLARDAPKKIDDIHPPKYYHNARKLSAPSRPHTNP